MQFFVLFYVFLYFFCYECCSLHDVVAALAAAVAVGGGFKVAYSRVDEQFICEDVFQFVEESAHCIGWCYLFLFGWLLFGVHFF